MIDLLLNRIPIGWATAAFVIVSLIAGRQSPRRYVVLAVAALMWTLVGWQTRLLPHWVSPLARHNVDPFDVAIVLLTVGCGLGAVLLVQRDPSAKRVGISVAAFVGAVSDGVLGVIGLLLLIGAGLRPKW